MIENYSSKAIIKFLFDLICYNSDCKTCGLNDEFCDKIDTYCSNDISISNEYFKLCEEALNKDVWE